MFELFGLVLNIIIGINISIKTLIFLSMFLRFYMFDIDKKLRGT